MKLFLSEKDAYLNWIRLFDLDQLLPYSNMTRSLEGIASPLYYTSLTGFTEATTLLLEAGADVNAQGGEYSNALQAASARGHDAIIQQLLVAGADINAH